MSWFVPPVVCLVCYFVGIALGWYWRGVRERRLEAEDRRLEREDWGRKHMKFMAPVDYRCRCELVGNPNKPESIPGPVKYSPEKRDGEGS